MKSIPEAVEEYRYPFPSGDFRPDSKIRLMIEDFAIRYVEKYLEALKKESEQLVIEGKELKKEGEALQKQLNIEEGNGTRLLVEVKDRDERLKLRAKLAVHTLDCAKEKLEIYRNNTDGEYKGGLEHTSMIRMINETLAIFKGDLNGKSGGPG